MPAGARRFALAAIAVAALAAPSSADAKLPQPKTTVIIPGKSIAGVKLNMSQAEVFGQWGSTACPLDICTWEGPGQAGKRERATVSFSKGKIVLISIACATKGTDLQFKPGVLSEWTTKTGNVSLGSKKSAVKRAYPAAKPNDSDGVNGFDLFIGSTYTRFSTPGVGASADLLRYITLAPA